MTVGEQIRWLYDCVSLDRNSFLKYPTSKWVSAKGGKCYGVTSTFVDAHGAMCGLFTLVMAKINAFSVNVGCLEAIYEIHAFRW